MLLGSDYLIDILILQLLEADFGGVTALHDVKHVFVEILDYFLLNHFADLRAVDNVFNCSIIVALVLFENVLLVDATESGGLDVLKDDDLEDLGV